MKKKSDLSEQENFSAIKPSTLFGIKTLSESLAENSFGKTIPTGCKMLNEFLKFFELSFF